MPPRRQSVAGAFSEPLLQAVTAGKIDEVESLLAARADPSLSYFNGGKSLLFLAAAKAEGAQALCEQLLSHRADPSAKDPRLRQTPLFYAVRRGPDAGGAECAKRLLEARCDPNHADINGQTPLFYSVQRPSNTCTSVLLAANADLTHLDKLGHTACSWASRANATCMLYGAVKDAAALDVQMLLQKEADPLTWLIPGGQNLIFVAAARMREAQEVCRLLVDKRVDPTAVDTRYKQTSLFFAVRGMGSSGGVDCARYLLLQGCSHAHADINGHTPLFYAAQRSDSLCVQELLAVMADVNHLDVRKQNACFYASRSDAISALQVLLEQNASPSVADDIGQTALFYSKSSASVDLLITHKAEANHADSAGRTPLMVVSAMGFAPAVHALCTASADLHSSDKDGSTCLFYSAKAGSKRMCQLLLEKRADPLHKDHQGRAPRDIANHANAEELEEIKALLQQAMQAEAPASLASASAATAAALAALAAIKLPASVAAAPGSPQSSQVGHRGRVVTKGMVVVRDEKAGRAESPQSRVSVKRPRTPAEAPEEDLASDIFTDVGVSSEIEAGSERLTAELGSLPLRTLEVVEAVGQEEKHSAMLLHFSKNTFQEERELVEYRIFCGKECGCRTWVLMAPYTEASIAALAELAAPEPPRPAPAQLQALATTRTRKRGAKVSRLAADAAAGTKPSAQGRGHCLAAVTVRINKYRSKRGFAWAQVLNMSTRRERQGLGTLLIAGLEVALQKDCGVDVSVLYPADNGRAPSFWSSLGYSQREQSLLPDEELVPFENGGPLLPEYDPGTQKTLPRWEKNLLGGAESSGLSRQASVVSRASSRQSSKSKTSKTGKSQEQSEAGARRVHGEQLLMALRSLREQRRNWKHARQSGL